jgi:acyl CoA:acetate/3-ketoacid CoA transferase beta subunit
VIDVVRNVGFVAREIAPDVSRDELQQATEALLHFAPDLRRFAL